MVKETLNRKNRHQDSAPTEVPLWLKIGAWALTLAASLLYIVLYLVVIEYQQRFAGSVNELPVFTRVILNIYQSYLGVFILISLALLVLFFIKSRHATGSYKIVFLLIAFNTVFAAVLFSVSFMGMV
ncbi:MAG: hypothetical protein PVJ72_18895 [Gammaproteobacteria bacterium]